MVDIVNSLWTNKEWLFSGIGVVVIFGCLGWIIRTLYHRRHKQNNTELKQIQIAGDNSVNTQAGGNLSVSDSNIGGRENVK